MERKWVHFLFALSGIVAYFLLKSTSEWIWSLFGKPKTYITMPVSFLVSAVAVYVAWKSEELFSLASECVTELMRVSWPTRKETMTATLVVIVTVIVASVFLGIFDGMWAFLSRQLYG